MSGQLHVYMDGILKEALAAEARYNHRSLGKHAAFLLEERAREYLRSLPKPVPRKLTEQEKRDQAWAETMREYDRQQQQQRQQH